MSQTRSRSSSFKGQIVSVGLSIGKREVGLRLQGILVTIVTRFVTIATHFVTIVTKMMRILQSTYLCAGVTLRAIGTGGRF